MNAKLNWIIAQIIYASCVYGWVILHNKEAKWVVLFLSFFSLAISMTVPEQYMKRIIKQRISKRMPFVVRFITNLIFVSIFLYFGKYIVAICLFFSFSFLEEKNRKTLSLLRSCDKDYQFTNKEIFP